MKRIILLFCLFVSLQLNAQHIQIPASLDQEHPRVLTNAKGKEETKQLIANEAWAKDVYTKLKLRIDTYVNRHITDPEWIVSRLQMYWKTHSTDVFINGEVYSHAEGCAPVPTVRYTGTRAATTIYSRPKLEDILPYMDDPQGLYFHNNSKEGRPLEWAEQSKTGRNIESINLGIMNMARDAAFVYWISGEEKYAKFAQDLFDMYMTGMYYRKVPYDLNHGHQQTLVGLSSFEVIHEDILNALVSAYDFLYYYLKEQKADKMDIYATTFKKFADNIIDRGVPHNNWDLFQAVYINNIGLILEDNDRYADKKGRGYYLDYVLNKSSIRQWSLTKLMNYGFDPNTGIWGECPGYSQNVVADFANFVDMYARTMNFDALEQMPVIKKAVAHIPQYLFPNGLTTGFGDTHYGKPRTDFYARMIANAQKFNKKEQENYFTGMYKLLNEDAGKATKDKKNIPAEITSFFSDKPLVLDPSVATGKIEDYTSPLFYAPNVSWLVQRNSMNPRYGLMISEAASLGNHMHSNGITMELYGKGYILGPDAGLGSGYFAQDYAEYYSQFLAHNTVIVDGISRYPEMKSNHGFEVKGNYPQSEQRDGIYTGITYSDVSFLEPETQADQNRLMSIIRTDDKHGYYVDVFRSKKQKGGDKMHDYIYHNLGQKISVADAASGDSLNLKPTDDLAFAGAHLYAYSYLYNQKSQVTDKDIKTTFTMNMPGGDDVSMNMWIKGEKEREVFSVLAPYTEGMARTPMPYDIKNSPTLTFVARQNGEAWTRPFVSIFEPSSKNEPSNIASVSYFNAKTVANDFVGIKIESKNGRMDYIFSSESATKAMYQNMISEAAYAVIGVENSGNCVLFMGNGRLLKGANCSIETSVLANAILENKQGKWFYSSSVPCKIVISGKTYKLPASNYVEIKR
nr:six-hairpin glycosidase [uncultured Bacteroides sp.]